ncbi:MAG: helix-hairpin-helix domain-containing protein [Clostridia bacterium]|nr:helix-hairpin-helix domain-containing protein [Clostridia bacterium]
MDKKEKIKIFLIILVIVGIVVYTIISYKKEIDEFEYYDENTIFTNETEVVENKVGNEEISKIKVYITGDVNNPGVKELEIGARIEDLINVAGGLTVNADISGVNLAYCLEDGMKVNIPNINNKVENEIITTENESGIIENMENKNSVKINLNKATVAELCELPGVGESLAQRIIDYRKENGNFRNIEDLKNVSGFGDKKYESIKEYIVVK